MRRFGLLEAFVKGLCLQNPRSQGLILPRRPVGLLLHDYRKGLPAHALNHRQIHHRLTHPYRSSHTAARGSSTAPVADMADAGGKYYSWEKDRLIARIRQLEHELAKRDAAASSKSAGPGPGSGTATVDAAPPPAKKRKKDKKMDASRYSSRFIALKFAYLGKRYGGFEYASSASLPTIEGELWNALTKACLIFPEDPEVVNFDCCEYSKCGRTDRGVSAFGQVIALRVRSSKPLPKKPEEQAIPETEGDTAMEGTVEKAEGEEDNKKPEKEWDDIEDEIPYVKVLNRLLPDDIRVIAWCPAPPPGFSARFSCEERQYRYFFTQPAFTPTAVTATDGAPPDGLREGYLDIEAMNEAARRFVGDHDFRNFCKVDGSKQITSFERRMYEAGVEEVQDVGSVLPYLGRGAADGNDKLPRVYSFNIRGTAFLWHQIRHMVTILFLVGQRLEGPDVITRLLDVEKTPRKPNYDLAHETPLVLWNCVFPGDDDSRIPTAPESALRWVYGEADVVESLWAHYREKKMDEVLANRLLDLISGQVQSTEPKPKGKRVFQGGHEGKLSGGYVPLAKKQLTPTPEEINNRWAQRKGFKNAEEMRESKNWRKAIKDAKQAGTTAAAAAAAAAEAVDE